MVTDQALASVIGAAERRKSLTMTASDRAPREARAFTREALTDWGLEDLLDRTVLIVSELTTNAERHGCSPAAPGGSEDKSADDRKEHITLTLAVHTGGVGIEVEDSSPLPPTPRDASVDSIDGRGLQLVSAEADAWVACPKADGSGKRVVALVRRPDPCPAS
ncbi:ATP-binding protein [Streptomyces sp. NBC_01381]|uniref:ATP-binding protein n=1 Tax=Streptomyces sp. NBC_01381 TaxID=2903845 RepID=UPI002253FE17|nr:ATP-binding protein [Streptomyces sp. NBC_01381]MCX4673031.1 ATP-binding protein [Streptomyces sp. NBC_01381]